MKHRVSFDHRTQGTQVETEATKIIVDTTRRGLEFKRAEVTDDFLQGLEIARREFKTQLAHVEARIERGSCQITGNRADVV
jgi:Trp operon repressor